MGEAAEPGSRRCSSFNGGGRGCNQSGRKNPFNAAQSARTPGRARDPVAAGLLEEPDRSWRVPESSRPAETAGERKQEKMKLNRGGSLVLLGVGALATAFAVQAQSTKVVSSFGPTNQDVTFSHIKADRLAVKAERAKAHAALLASTTSWTRRPLPPRRGARPSSRARDDAPRVTRLPTTPITACTT